MAERVESLIFLQEVIREVEKNDMVIKESANALMRAFTHILKDIFERPAEDFPLRFAKYFITVFELSCSCKALMLEVKEEELYEMTE